MKKLMLAVILFGFIFLVGACAGPQRISIKQCKEATATESECMSIEITGDISILPF